MFLGSILPMLKPFLHAQTISACSRHGDLSGHLPGSTKVAWVLTPPLAIRPLPRPANLWANGPCSPTSVLIAASESC